MDPIHPSSVTPNPVLGSGLTAVETGPAVSMAPVMPPVESEVPNELPSSPKRRFPLQIIAMIGLVFTLLVGGGAAYFLTQQSQDVRNQASSGTVCGATTSNPFNLDCGGKTVGVEYTAGNYKFSCQNPVSVPINPTTQSIRCDAVASQAFCGECQKWFPTSLGGSCAQRCAGSGGSVPPDVDEDGDGDDEQTQCGGIGQPCCDPNGQSACTTGYCEVGAGSGIGTCRANPPTNLCQGEEGTGEFNGKCVFYNCGKAGQGGKCNMANECTIDVQNAPEVGDCNTLAEKMFSQGYCGQVDYTSGAAGSTKYCGVKAINCGGGCQPSNPPVVSGGQCKEVIGRVGVPGSGTAEEVAPRIGDQFFLKCRKVSGAVAYKFRVFYTKQKGANAYASLLNKKALKVKSTEERKHISQFVTIDRAGFYYGQCKVCMPDAGSPNGKKCSPWESVANSAKQLPFPQPLPGDPEYIHSNVDADDGLPNGQHVNLRSIEDIFDITGEPEDPEDTTDNVIDPIIGNPEATE